MFCTLQILVSNRFLFEPVVAADTEEYAIREEDIPQIMEEYDALAKEMIAREKAGKGFKLLPLYD